MKPQEIAEKWISCNSKIWPIHKNEEFKEMHTYPCPTLTDNEYRGEDLEFYPYNIVDCTNKCAIYSQRRIRLKQPPAIGAGEAVDEVSDLWKSIYATIAYSFANAELENKPQSDAIGNATESICTHAPKGYVRVDDVVKALNSYRGWRLAPRTIEDIITKIKNLTK